MNERIPTAGMDEDSEDDRSLRELLREAGARDVPSVDMMNEVRQVVQGEWRELVEQRQRRRRFVGFSAAAGIAAAVVAVTLVFQMGANTGEPVATVARVDGVLQAAAGGSDEWHPVVQGATVASGSMLRTDEGTRVALTLPNGVSMRIAAGTLIELKSPERVALDSGALYVDANHGADAPTDQAPVIETLYGAVRHLGTQYEVRTMRSGIEVSVREGRVEIAGQGDTYVGAAGERMTIGNQGVSERNRISTQDPRWQWATSIAPVFDIERQPLSRFLEWVARETGKPVAYATPDLRASAGQLILRGSINNLPPEQALAAVLATTPFKHSETEAAILIH